LVVASGMFAFDPAAGGVTPAAGAGGVIGGATGGCAEDCAGCRLGGFGM
jgi:hypothetical protein